jgi:hypothetical protein
MNSRQRFLKTMLGNQPDRVPLFEEGLRKGVLKAWQEQGLLPGSDLSQIYPFDRREEIEIDLELQVFPEQSLLIPADLIAFQNQLDPYDPRRLPPDWSKRLAGWRGRDHTLMLCVHPGFFLTMGVDGWRRFRELMDLLVDKPDLIRRMMEIQGEFAAKLTERVLADVEIDAAIFSEPIGGNHGPLISPSMYTDLVLPSYRPVIEVLHAHDVETIVVRTYANARVLLPGMVNAGINCLWACEVEPTAMDYLDIRAEYGSKLRLIGGIDLDTLRSDKEDILREVKRVIPPLLADGGFIPLADGRVREDVPYENYRYYRHLLAEITGAR